jgi:cysteine-rich repeat protein
VESPEGCDDGNYLNGDGCSVVCTVEEGWQCTGSPSVCQSTATCANGILESPEGCDDGNLTSNDGCSLSCTVELGWQCSGSPSTCVYVGYCGDGVLQPGEECDDNNNTNNDGCSASCTFEGPVKGLAINEDGTRPAPGAIVDIKSSDKGILIPRMTTAQRIAIQNTPAGLLVFDLTSGSFWYYNGNAWKELAVN